MVIPAGPVSFDIDCLSKIAVFLENAFDLNVRDAHIEIFADVSQPQNSDIGLNEFSQFPVFFGHRPNAVMLVNDFFFF
jgi:hypothetical protein